MISINSYYNSIAKKHGLSPKSTMEDDFVRQTEINFFLGSLKNHPKPHSILEIGSGNGHLLALINKLLPGSLLSSVELSPELCRLIDKRNILNLDLKNGSCSDPLIFQKEKFDVVISCRVLINLKSPLEQKMAIQNIAHTLKPGGFFYLSESFKEPFNELNRARHEMALAHIPVPQKNRYLPIEFMNNYPQKCGLKKIETKNLLSSHFFMSRVFHPVIKNKKSKVKNGRFVEFFSRGLPGDIGSYSPILFQAFQKPS